MSILLDIQHIIPHVDFDKPSTPQEEILISKFINMRESSTLSGFVQKSQILYESLFLPIDMKVIQDQKPLIKLIKQIIGTLLHIHPLFGSHFIPLIKRLSTRYAQAKIDQDVFESNGFIPNLFPTKLPDFLNLIQEKFIGSIYVCSQSSGGEKTIFSSSGMLVNFDSNKIQNLENNKEIPLNAVLTCCHTFKIQEGHHFIGAYFVLNSSLDIVSGFPISLNCLTVINSETFLSF